MIRQSLGAWGDTPVNCHPLRAIADPLLLNNFLHHGETSSLNGKHMGHVQLWASFCRHNLTFLLRIVGSYIGSYLPFSETAKLLQSRLIFCLHQHALGISLLCVLCQN